MDYYKIGQKIRKFRKAHGLSQEQLAEQAGISVTHMSHIETGNTKLSLSVFVEIARILDVAADELLFDVQSERKISISEIADIIDACNSQQIRIITDIVCASKVALDKYLVG